MTKKTILEFMLLGGFACCALGLTPQEAHATFVPAHMPVRVVIPQENTAGQTYYVAPYGDDANPGSFSEPWRTIQKAADTLTAGDTVLIRGGTYGEQVYPRFSGSEGKPITYAAYPGETVAIDGQGQNLPEWGGLFYVWGKRYITMLSWQGTRLNWQTMMASRKT